MCIKYFKKNDKIYKADNQKDKVINIMIYFFNNNKLYPDEAERGFYEGKYCNIR